MGRPALHPIVAGPDGAPGKVCRECKVWQPLDRFRKMKRHAGGHHNDCSTCEGRKAYRRNPSAKIAAVLRYRARNRDTLRVLKNALNQIRHRRAMAGPGVTTDQIRRLFAEHDGKCFYCKIAVADTIDHKLPLSRGGLHEIGNLAPACRKCNFSKHALTPEEWAARKEK